MTKKNNNNEGLLVAALAYAELGYSVFPCWGGSKVPMTPHGFKDATTERDRIKAWWSKNPAANIGIPTAGLLVVDVDGETNDWPHDDGKVKDLSRGVASLTPSGGRHHVFRQPAGKDWNNTTGKLGPNVDTRANGGYIVVPPSIIDGKAYRWVETMSLEVPPGMLPEPPGWLVSELEGKRDALEDPGDGRRIPSGQRNSTLARLAGAMRRVGMTEPEIVAALEKINEDRCHPPLPEGEVRKIAKSIGRYEPDQVAVADAESHWDQDQESSGGAGQFDPGPMPDELLRFPGFVSELVDYNLETAPYPNRVLAFCGALVLQAFLSGRKVRDPCDNRTNLYILGLAHSGAGKDWPRKINARIMHSIGLSDCLGDRFASSEGVQDALFVNPSMLFQTDEMDTMIQAINRARDARYENIMATLLTLYSSANSVFPMRRKVGRESPGAIDQPSLSLFGTAIPNHYYEALSERMLTNGLFARMLILESGPRGTGQDPLIREIPERIMETARWWAGYRPGEGNLEQWHPVPAIVPYTDEARSTLAVVRKDAEEEYTNAEASNDPIGTAVWGRVNEQARKLALLRAVSQDYQAPEIGRDDAEWAIAFTLHQTRRMLFMAQSHVADSPFQAKCLKVIQKLREAPDRTLTHSVLLKRMKVEARMFRSIITTLEQRGEVQVKTIPTSGSPKRFYQLRGEACRESEKSGR